MKKIFFILIIFTSHTILINAQQATFSKVFSNFPLNPENGAILKEVPEGFLALSFSGCLDNINKECCSLVKMNDEGKVIWFKQYPFHGGSSTLEITDSRIYISGHTDTGDNQFVLYCLDNEGNIIWNKEYGEPNEREVFPRLSFYGDKLVLCGSKDRNINNRPAPMLYFVITDLEGNLLQEFYYGEQNETTIPRTIEKDVWGNLMFSFLYCPNSCFLDLKGGILRLNPTDDLSLLIDLPYSYEPTQPSAFQIDSTTLAVKWHIDSNLPNYDLTPPAIFFTDLQGTVQDTLVFENQSLKEVFNMEPIWEKGLVGCGSNYTDNNINTLAGWVFRMDENREIIWERTYLDTTYNGQSFGLNQVIPTNDGGYIATGTITNFMTGVWESHNWILKLDSLGCLEPNCGGLNYVSKTDEIIFLKGKDIKIYPNPASDYVQVEFPTDFDLKDVTVRLISNEGKLIKQTPINTDLQTLSLAGIVSGTYYAIITRGNEIITSKRVIIYH